MNFISNKFRKKALIVRKHVFKIRLADRRVHSHSFCSVFLVFLSLLISLTHCCTNLKKESKIVLEKNGYTNIVVGIEEGVRENHLLIEKIKESFTEASHLLFNITRYFDKKNTFLFFLV